MNKLLVGLCSLAGIVALAVAGELIRNAAGDHLLAPDVDALLIQVATKMNERLPMMVDEQTRLKYMAGGPGKTFTDFYSLPSFAAADIDGESLRHVVAGTIRQRECAMSEMRRLFEKFVTANFVYRGNDCIDIIRTKVNPADCGIDS